MIDVFQCGGGTQSARIALGICRGEFPKPDFAVIADTGHERSTTWQYMEQVLQPKLGEAGVELIRVRASEYSYEHDGLFNKKGTLLIPAYSTQTEIPGSNGKMSNFCTSYWKRDVIDNFFRRQGIALKDCRKWIGFSVDEMRRAVRMMNTEDFKAGRIIFPLIERRLRRSESIFAVHAAGWPAAPRSNCYFCPNQEDGEWLSLTEEELRMAIAWERIVRAKDPDIYFHVSRIPLDQVIFKPTGSTGGGGCASGECFL